MQLTADGARYWMASEKPVPYPFHLRWLLPFMLRQNERAWAYVGRGSIVAIGFLTAAYTHSPWMACVAFLPGFKLSWDYPVLVDAPGMALALAAAVVWPYSMPAAIAIVLAAGCTRETAPVWAAVYAWNPILLVGMAPVALRTLRKAAKDDILEDEEHEWIIRNPLKAGQKYHAGHWRDPLIMVTPWGGMAVAAAYLDAQLGAALALGYAQLLVATDTVRLYQWAAPVVALVCARNLPGWALPLVAASVIFNPWAGDGM